MAAKKNPAPAKRQSGRQVGSQSRRRPGAGESREFLVRSDLYRTARLLIICATIVAALWIVANAVVTILDEPGWVTITLAAITVVLGPTGLVFYVLKRWGKYAKSNFARTRQLEQERDPTRSSTGLRPDGTNPPEDGI